MNDLYQCRKWGKISPHYSKRNSLVKSPQKAGQSCAENSASSDFNLLVSHSLQLVGDKAHGKFISIHISSLTETSGISPGNCNSTWRTMTTK